MFIHNGTIYIYILPLLKIQLLALDNVQCAFQMCSLLVPDSDLQKNNIKNVEERSNAHCCGGIDCQFMHKMGFLVLDPIRLEIQTYSILVKWPLFCLATLPTTYPSICNLSFVHFNGYFLVYRDACCLKY